MALPDFSMRQLLEAGVHFGHQKHRWNPKMGPYIFGIRNNVHIIDLAQTVPLLHRALQQVSDTVASGGRVLFVGTKRQASEPITQAARRSAQYYVNARWLGGMLTNWRTMSRSIKRLRDLEEVLEAGGQGLTKKELLTLTRERDRLERDIGGIKDMGGIPDLLFVIDTNKESIAIKEAKRLGIPVAAVVDSNCDPDEITFPIPGNDDAGRAITLYCDLIARAAIDGIGRSAADAGIDVGAAAEPTMQAEVDAAVAADVATATEATTAPVETGAGDADMAAAAALEPQAIDSASPDASADAAAETDEAAPLFERPDGEPDDLTKISGVGKVLERKLHELGVTKYAQIVAFSDTDIARVDDALSFKGRIQRDNWIGQAEQLVGEA